MSKKKRKYPKLRGKVKTLASMFIAEEMRTKKYPRKQAIAIGISRARVKVKRDKLPFGKDLKRLRLLTSKIK